MVDFTKPQSGKYNMKEVTNQGITVEGQSDPLVEHKVESQSNLLLAFAAALLVGLVCAFVWGVVGYYLETMPLVLILGMGALVGGVIQSVGKSKNKIVVPISALLGLVPWFFGTIFFVALSFSNGDILQSFEVVVQVPDWFNMIEEYLSMGDVEGLLFDIVFVLGSMILSAVVSVKREPLTLKTAQVKLDSTKE